MDNLTLEPHLQRMVDAGVSGTDILHGELKNLMLMAEQELAEASEREQETEEAMEYNLTYALSFAISDRMKLTNQ